MRIPVHIKSLVENWSGYWAAARIRDGVLRIRYAQNGERTAVFCRGGNRDYYLWDEHTQQRIRSFGRAQDMWAFASMILEQGPQHYGLCVNPWSTIAEEVINHES